MDERRPMTSSSQVYGAAGIAAGVVIDEHLRIEKYISSGGMCDVYQATHLLFQRKSAIKFLKPSMLAGSNALKRFQREAVICSKLRHANIIEVFAIGTFNERPFIAMEFLPGRSLADLLNSTPSNKLSLSDALPLFVQICDALTYAHQQGVVHRDLKPSNVMLVDGDKTVKLMDFGIATAIPESRSDLQRLTHTGELLGSLPYMSPEQCQGMQLDARSDIYSFGCLMYEVLTGAPPFASAEPLSLLIKHINDAANQTEELNNALGQVVMKTLEKDPSRSSAIG